MKRGYVYTFGIVLGLSVASFFYVLPAFALDTSFEDYDLGILAGQKTFTQFSSYPSYGVVGSVLAHTGFQMIESPSTATTSIYNATFATSSSGELCEYIYFYNNDDHGDYFLTLREPLPSTRYMTLKIVSGGKNIYYWDGSYHDSGVDAVESGWRQICFYWTPTQIQYKLWNATTTPWLSSVGSGFNTWRHEITSDGTGGQVYVDDVYLDDTEIDEEPAMTDKLAWKFPENDAILDNDEWNDYELYVDLDNADIDDFNLLAISCTDSAGVNNTQWDTLPSTTTDVMLVVENREKDFTDGNVMCLADLVKVNCDDLEDDDCIWVSIEQEYVSWISSSTGWSKFDVDFPYGIIATFTPATTTYHDTDDLGIFSNMWSGFKNMFPIGLGWQLYGMAKTINTDPGLAPLEITLAQFLPDEAADLATGTLLSADLLEVAPWWEDNLYPLFRLIIWGMTAVFLLLIIFPKAEKS